MDYIIIVYCSVFFSEEIVGLIYIFIMNNVNNSFGHYLYFLQ